MVAFLAFGGDVGADAETTGDPGAAGASEDMVTNSQIRINTTISCKNGRRAGLELLFIQHNRNGGATPYHALSLNQKRMRFWRSMSATKEHNPFQS